jgi:cytochrome P450
VNLSPFSHPYMSKPALVWRDLLDGPDPVVYAEDLNLWLLFRYPHVRRALTDTQAFSNAATLLPIYEMDPEALSIVMDIDAPPTTAAADAPTHTRTRTALRYVFANTAERVEERYGNIVRDRVNQLIDPPDGLAAQHGRTVDLMTDLAAQLPLLVVCDLLGVPEDDIPQVKAWSDGQIALVWGNPDPATQKRLATALRDFWHYCQQLTESWAFARRWAHTDQDNVIVRALRFRGDDDATITLDEIASLAFNLLVAGHETTSGLIAHALEHVLRDQHLWARMTTSPLTVSGVIEETLRIGPPIDGWLRMTTRDVTFDDVTIPAGARCLLLLGATGHDTTVPGFQQPEVFDPHRPLTDTVGPPRHLAFGAGPHYCIGAVLARLEARTVLTRLGQQIPGLTLAAEATAYEQNAAFRRPTELLARIPEGEL